MKEIYDNNLDKVCGFLDEFYQDEQNYKKNWARIAKRNVSFANGDQNPNPMAAPVMINNQPVTSQSSDYRLNAYQTNEIEPIIRTLVSYMTRAKPAVKCNAASDEEREKNIARVAERLLEAKYDLNKEQYNSKMAAFWALTTGTVFSKDYWDYTLGSYLPMIDEEGQEVLDPETGEVVIDSQKTGNNNSAILTPLSICLDHSIVEFEQQLMIGEMYVMDVDWAKEAFDRDGPGYTGKARDIKEDGYIGDTLLTLEEMKFSVPYVSSGSQYKSKGKCLIKEWYIRPSMAYPKGRMIIKAGDRVVYDSPPEIGSPYYMNFEPVMWHPYSMFVYEPFVGRLLGKSLVEQLVPLQMRINEINGAILENANTLARPNILTAENQLKRGVLNGRGANIYTYRPVPGGAMPTVLPGAPLPAQFFNELQSLRDRMVMIAGTNFVMQGQPPTGVTAASAINQLLENANTQHSDMMLSWEKFHEQKYTKKLRIIHKFMQFPDPYLDKYLKFLCRDVLETQIEDFVGARDLSDGINVEIEFGSMIPKSQTAKNDLYKEIAMSGGLGPAMMEDSPRGEKIRAQLIKKMGLEPLESEESVEEKKARWENDRILKGLPVSVSQYDISAIHLPCHKTKIQDPKFLESANEEQIAALEAHIQEHIARDQEQQMIQMQSQTTPESMPQDLGEQMDPQAMDGQAAEGPMQAA